MRIGFGYDVHRLVEGRLLVLGGVEIPHSLGLSGHSDADVLIHAVMDALLGAAGAGDIGQHFPDSDPAYRGISSLLLLEQVGQELARRSFQVVNIDSVIVAQAPRLSGYRTAMEGNMARALNISSHQINVKATTTEGLGFTGVREGMASYATVLINKT